VDVYATQRLRAPSRTTVPETEAGAHPQQETVGAPAPPLDAFPLRMVRTARNHTSPGSAFAANFVTAWLCNMYQMYWTATQRLVQPLSKPPLPVRTGRGLG